MKFLLILFLVSITPIAKAQEETQRMAHYNLKKGLALEGYDPVSYFDGNPQAGKSDLRFSYNGIIYQFSTQKNLSRFKANPEMFEPAYGGWCAYAMGKTAEKVKIDPETFKILDGKLYLFYNFWGNNTLTEWNKQEAALREKGDRNWSLFLR